jgi:hypothetical protein
MQWKTRAEANGRRLERAEVIEVLEMLRWNVTTRYLPSAR